jgi:dynein heavy chain
LFKVRLALTAPLIIKNPQTNKYIVNFDPYIIEVIRESEYMLKFGLDVPDFIKILFICKRKILDHVEIIKDLVIENNNLRRSIPPLFLKLIKPCLIELETTFQPCLSVITWTSLMIYDTCENIRKTIKNAKIFLKKVVDMKEARIDEIFESIANTKLIEFVNYPQYPLQFSSGVTEFSIKVGYELGIKSSTAEQAVKEIINLFVDLIKDSSIEKTKYDWLDSSKVSKAVTSQTNLTEGIFEPGN